MELSNYQAFMECMRKWEKIGCNILCGLALWEQMQDCDRRGVPYTDIDIEAVSQEVAYRLTGICGKPILNSLTPAFTPPF